LHYVCYLSYAAHSDNFFSSDAIALKKRMTKNKEKKKPIEL